MRARQILISPLVALLLTATSSSVVAQTTTTGSATAKYIAGTITTNGDIVRLNNPDRLGAGGIQIETSGGTGTISFEGKTRTSGTTYTAIYCTSRTSSTGAVASSATAAGQWQCPVGGLTSFQIRASATITGTFTVALSTGQGGGAGGASGGGGGGGDASASNQETEIARLDTIITHVDGVEASLTTLAGAVAGSEVQVDVLTLPAITGTVTANAGTNLNTSALLTTSAFNTVFGSSGMIVTTQLDDMSNTVDGLQTTSMLYMFDGTAFDRVRGTAADGLLVNLGTNNDVTVTGTVTVTDGAGALNVIVDSGALTATVSDGAGALNVIVDSGSVSCSNCSGSGASDVDNSTFTLGTDSVAPVGYYFDDVTPGAATEDRVGLARMSGNRVPYSILRDAAGNERGANVNASNQLAIAGPVTNAGTFVTQENGALLTAAQLLDNAIGTVAAGTAATASLFAGGIYNSTPITLTNGQGAAMQVDANGYQKVNVAAGGTSGPTDTSDTSVATGQTAGLGIALNYVLNAAGTAWVPGSAADETEGSATILTGPRVMGRYADFDGTALPTPTNVDTEGEAVTLATSIKGVQYMMLTSEDGSLQYGTSTTPLVVGDGTGALNTIVDSGTLTAVTSITNPVTVTATNFDVQIGGSDSLTIGTFPDNEPFNLAQANGVTILMGNGATGTGSMRFTLANDNTLPTGWPSAANQTTMIGHLDGLEGFVDGIEALIGTTNTNTGNLAASSQHYRTSAGSTEDEFEVKATPGVLTGGIVTNTNAAARYLRCSNLTAANTTPGTSTVFFGAAIPGNTAAAGFTLPIPPGGLTFSTALTCWLVTGAADTDVAEVAANEIKVNLFFR